MSKTPATYSIWLDFIRGVAAFVVFAGHARVLFVGSILGQVGIGTQQGSVARQATGHATTDPGHIAVIVFFVLSGYLVGGSVIRAMNNGRWSPANYAVQRISRLWTVLLPVLALGFLLDHLGMFLLGSGGIYGAPRGQGIVFEDIAERLTLSTVLGNAFFVQGILVKTMGTNSPLWTLSYEFWFYVAFPFVAVMTRRESATSARIGCLGVLLGLYMFVGWRIAFYFFLWMLGALLEIVPKSLPRRIARRCALISALIFVVVCIALLKFKLSLFVSDTIEAFAFSLMCYFILHETAPYTANAFSRFSVSISSMSYTLYLTHAPILVFISALVMSSWAPWPVSMAGLLKFSAVTFVAFLVSVAMYRLFERRTPLVRNSMLSRVPRRWLLYTVGPSRQADPQGR